MTLKKGFTLIEILVALGLLAIMAVSVFVFQNTYFAHLQKLKQKQITLQHMQNLLETIRGMPYAQIQTHVPERVIVTEIKPGLKEILVVSGNLKLYTRRFNNP